RDQSRPLYAGGDRRDQQRDRRLLLSEHRQDHVLRRGGAELPPGPGHHQGRDRRGRAVQPAVRVLRGADPEPPHPPPHVPFLMQLAPTAAAAGGRRITHDTIGSTNEEALRLARAGERAPLWVTARQQTAGRGRRGRTWVSEPGNLYASLLLADPSPPDRFPE